MDLLSQFQDNILILTVNRPEALNALNPELIAEIGNKLEEIESRDDIFGAIITGSGEKAFAAGADIKNFPALTARDGAELSRAGHEVFHYIENFPKPVVAAINGYALGGGLELALACHMRIAVAEAVFGMPEVKLGLIPGYGGTQRFTALVGKSKAFEYILTGNMMDAVEAHRLGLINQVVIREELMSVAAGFLKTIGKRGPKAVAAAIQLINAYYNSSVSAYDMEIQKFGMLMESDESKEGVAAFLEKRTPHFRK